MKPSPPIPRWACLLTATVLFASVAGTATAAPDTYVGRPIYSDPAHGLQLPPECAIEPSWRSRIGRSEMEVWVVNCDGVAHLWLLTRQVVEMISAREARLRFQIVDERVLAEEKAGDSLSVQCSGANDESGVAVYGARWRSSGRELRLASARGAVQGNPAQRRLADIQLTGVECVRFPEREAMLRQLQQGEHAGH